MRSSTAPLAFITVLTALLSLFSACKEGITGAENENSPPETYTIVDTIIRVGEDRLNSQVNIQWWGDDSDGYIAAYEYYFDTSGLASEDWNITTLKDSIFLLSTPPGLDTLDFRFVVRAIDNLGIADPTPAELTFPIKNSPPEVMYIDGPHNPQCTYPVVKLFWNANDPDGLENISHYEIVWNDTTAASTELPVNASAATFVSSDVTADSAPFSIYLNNSVSPESYTIDNVSLNDTNRLYIRVVDKSASRSNFISSYPIYIKKPESDILLVNAYGNAGSLQNDFYTDLMTDLGFSSYASSDLFSTDSEGNSLELAPDNLTQSRLFSLFKTIIWYGNNASSNLSLAQRSTSDFFDNGGKMLMSMYVSSSFDEQSSFLDFTPISELIEPLDTTLLLTDTSTVVALDPSWPNLGSTAFVGVVRPFDLVPGATSLYNANIIARDDATNTFSLWTGQRSVIAKKTDSSGETNFILSTLELHKLDGAMNTNQFLEKVLVDEFGL